jgi:Rrf2 family protein
MKLSCHVAFAVAALALIDRAGPGATLKAHPLALAKRVGTVFARRVLGRLATAGVLLSKSGDYGGYTLARRPKDITLLEIVEAVDGPLLDPAEGAVNPLLRAVCEEVARVTRRRLAVITLAELAKREG